MGLYYEDVGDYKCALKAFLNACQHSPTAETWLSAGIAFYEVNYFNYLNYYLKYKIILLIKDINKAFHNL